MSQTGVSTALNTKLAAISGIVSVVKGIGDTNASMPAEFPIIQYSVGEQGEDQLTCGPSAMVDLTYVIEIQVLLGTPEMLAADAEDAKLLIDDRLRAAITSDRTLGGACFWCVLRAVGNNLPIFRDIEDYPTLKYQLFVEEFTNADVAAP